MENNRFQPPSALVSHPHHPHLQHQLQQQGCSTSNPEPRQTSPLNLSSRMAHHQVIRPNPQYPQNQQWLGQVPPPIQLVQHNFYMRQIIDLKDSELKQFCENENILRAKLACLQQRCNAQEQDVYNLSGKLQSVEMDTVPKAQFEIVMNQNKLLTQENTKLRQQNEKPKEDTELQTAKTEIEKLEKLNQKLVQEVDRGNDKLKKEREKKLKMKSNWESLKDIQKSWLVKKIQLETDVETFKEKVKDLEEKMASSEKSSGINANKLQSEIRALNTKLKSACDEADLLSAANVKVAENMEGYVNENKKLEGRIEKLEAEKQDDKSKMECLVKENESLKVKIESVEGEKQSFTKKHEDLEGENENLRVKVENLEDEKKSLEKELGESISKNSDEIHKLKEESNQTKSELLEAGKCIEKLKSESAKLKETHASERQQLQRKLDAEIRRGRQENANAHEQKSKMDRLSKQIEKEKESSKRRADYIATLKRLLAESKDEAKMLRTKVETLTLEKDYLNGQLDHSLGELKKLKPEITWAKGIAVGTENMSKRMEELERENQELEKQLAENSTLLKTQEEELKGQQLVMQLQKAALDNLEARKLELETSVTDQEETISELETAVTEKEAQILQLETQSKENEETIKKLDEEIKQKENNRVKLLLSQLQLRELDVSKMERELDKERKQVEKIQDESHQKSDKLREKEKQIELLDNVICGQKKEIERLKDAAKKLEEKHKIELAAKRSTIVSLMADKMNLKNSLEASSSRKIVISYNAVGEDERVTELSGENAALMKKLASKTEEVDELSLLLKKKMGEIGESTATIASLRSQIKNVEDSARKQERKNEACVKELCMELQRLEAKNVSPVDCDRKPKLVPIKLCDNISDDELPALPPVKKSRKRHDHHYDEPRDSKRSIKKRFRMDKGHIPVPLLKRNSQITMSPIDTKGVVVKVEVCDRELEPGEIVD